MLLWKNEYSMCRGVLDKLIDCQYYKAFEKENQEKNIIANIRLLITKIYEKLIRYFKKD